MKILGVYDKDGYRAYTPFGIRGSIFPGDVYFGTIVRGRIPAKNIIFPKVI